MKRRTNDKPDCGHVCCDTRDDPLHDHFLTPAACPRCKGIAPDLVPVIAHQLRESLDNEASFGDKVTDDEVTRCAEDIAARLNDRRRWSVIDV